MSRLIWLQAMKTEHERLSSTHDVFFCFKITSSKLHKYVIKKGT